MVSPWILSAAPRSSSTTRAAPPAGRSSLSRACRCPCFRRWQDLGVLRYEIGKTPHQSRPFGAGHLAPRPLVEGLAGGAHSPVHIFRVRLGHRGPLPTRVGIDALECLARTGPRPPAAYEHLILVSLPSLGRLDQLHPYLLLRRTRRRSRLSRRLASGRTLLHVPRSARPPLNGRVAARA